MNKLDQIADMLVNVCFSIAVIVISVISILLFVMIFIVIIYKYILFLL